jgi:threonylcarbamoyladenosine tRNA methylthiotransferase MtaB
MRKVRLVTVGCKVNQYDTQCIREDFLRNGFSEAKKSEPADVCVVNSCTVTAKADADSLYTLRKLTRENPRARIILTGCCADLALKRKHPIADDVMVIPNKKKGDIVSSLLRGRKARLQRKRGITSFSGHTRAFLKIQDGCDNYCSYCIVPFARGKPWSKKLSLIKAEASALVKNGFREIVLCGVCLGSYGKDLAGGLDLVTVINALENIEGIERIRLSSIELSDITEALIEKMLISRKLCRHLHIPLQSGDNEILEKMNRKSRREDFIGAIGRIKKSIPAIAITTDVIVGFPSEGESHFKNTVLLIQKLCPLRTHIFPFSPRVGTCAGAMRTMQVSPCAIEARISQLRDVAAACSANFRQRFLGEKADVLVESRHGDKPRYYKGYTDNYIPVMVHSKRDLVNQIVPVTLAALKDDGVIGELRK